MVLREASEVKKEQMYSDTRLAIEVMDAANEKKTRTYVNVDLVTDKQITRLKELGYSLYNTNGRLEISWEYAKIK
jgi:hypothetical protein|tara:strand:+ start:82 stop:306 length:225 start_codon:yes stop_codon:yes gene_type:complete